MRIEDFDFELPNEQIAQRPLDRRDGARLLVLARGDGRLDHRRFAELPALLKEGDLLVVNDSRVFPARLLGRKAGSGGKVELLLVRPESGSPEEALRAAPDQVDWICLGQASKGLKPGAQLEFDHGLGARVVEAAGRGQVRVAFHAPRGDGFAKVLERAGRLPLPPYIEREPTALDGERYQTVYASTLGSVAAPTAGLHFTPELLSALEAKGIARVAVTLEVGPGTFLPVRDGDIAGHQMHAERYWISEPVAEAIRRAKAEGRRIVAVGTTVVRALEAAGDRDGGGLPSGPGETCIFIKPPFEFRQVDALVTNFHLPRSTLLMLVSAFAGRDFALAAYRAAVVAGYRFFSYGDAMFIEGRRG